MTATRRSTTRTKASFAAALAVGFLSLLGARAQEMQRAQLGALAPDFSLRDTDDTTHTLSDLTREGRVVVLEWFDPDCPYAQKHHVRFDTWEKLFTRYRDQHVAFLAINSTRAGQEGSSLERNYEAREAMKIQYPLLLDPTGVVGHAYDATCSSQVAVIDRRGILVYTGAIDDDRSAERPGSVNYLALALDAVLAGKPVDTPTTRPYGCPIRY